MIDLELDEILYEFPEIVSMNQDCSYNELYPLQVLDDSMEPEFPKKCVIVIEPSQVCADGAFVIVSVNGERLFRQMVKSSDENHRLCPLNPAYSEVSLQGVEHKIEGVIVQRNIRRKIKHYKPYLPNNGEAGQLQ